MNKGAWIIILGVVLFTLVAAVPAGQAEDCRVVRAGSWQLEAASNHVSAAADHGEFFPLLSIVVRIEEVGSFSIVTCEDTDGEAWSFYADDETWTIGDMANLLMWDTGEIEERYEVIEVYWVGYCESMETFYELFMMY